MRTYRRPYSAICARRSLARPCHRTLGETDRAGALKRRVAATPSITQGDTLAVLDVVGQSETMIGVITWNNRIRRSAAVLAACCLVALVTACADSENTPPNEQSSAERTTSVTTGSVATTIGVESAMVDIGGGKELFLECRGEGSPMILLEAGDESGHEDWSKVDRELGEATRTCSYDRLGTGSSSEADGCRGIDEIVGDTESLIAAAELEGPFIFVGASGGG